jgi:putative transcriptional regulator
MALGYAGWEAGQLEQELMDNAWLTAQASSHILFETPLEDRWTAAAALVGVDPRQLSTYAGHA